MCFVWDMNWIFVYYLHKFQASEVRIIFELSPCSLSLWKWVPGISPGVKAAGAFDWRPTTLVVPKVEKIRGLNLPGTPRANSACCEIPLLYFYPTITCAKNRSCGYPVNMYGPTCRGTQARSGNFSSLERQKRKFYINQLCSTSHQYNLTQRDPNVWPQTTNLNGWSHLYSGQRSLHSDCDTRWAI